MNFFAYRFGKHMACDSDFDESKVRREKGGEHGGEFAKKPETLAKEDARDVLNKGEGCASGAAEALDAEYMDAVKSGDMEKAARMVRDAAARAMPKTKVVDKDGKPLGVYHSTDARFNAFDLDKSYGGGRFGAGIYLSTDKDFAQIHGKHTMTLFVNAEHILGTDFRAMKPQEKAKMARLAEKELGEEDGFNKEDLLDTMIDSDTLDNLYNVKPYFGDLSEAIDVFNRANKTHYNAVRDGKTGREICVYDNKVVKSADPVTYDDDGNVIPISRRFDFTIPDIRY